MTRKIKCRNDTVPVHWMNGKNAKGFGSLESKDNVLWSYAMIIGYRSRLGNLYVIDKKHSPSVTTSKHIAYAMRNTTPMIVAIVDKKTLHEMVKVKF